MSIMSYGPNPTEKYTNNSALNKFIDSSIKYVSSLNPFYKYCLWRYTIGSASINSRLIFGKMSDNSPYWTFLFFLYYHNTNPTVGNLPRMFLPFYEYFRNPISYNALALDKQMEIAQGVIIAYTASLQAILLEAPKTTGSFRVFKVSSYYPQLPKEGDPLPVSVLQLPFNSVTVSPYFNFAPFISPTVDCCLFDIEIPAGSSCVYVPSDFHAYNFEHEIILPHHCIFNIQNISRTILNYIDPANVNIVMLQPKDKIQLGNVYAINEYTPCKVGSCLIQQRPFTLYSAVYVNP